MNDHARTLTSILAAIGAVSLEQLSTVFCILASIVAILAGLPAALRTIRALTRAARSFFKPATPPPSP